MSDYEKELEKLREEFKKELEKLREEMLHEMDEKIEKYQRDHKGRVADQMRGRG